MSATQAIKNNNITGKPLRRYSRFVHSTKFMLGIVALLLTLLILFYPVFKKQAGGVRISLTSTAEKPVQATTMTNARFHGLDKDNQLYTVTAKQVTEVSEDQINLAEPSGEIFLKTTQRLSVKANNGIFFKKDRMLKLKGAIKLYNDEGYTLTTETMSVDIANNSAATSTEVFGNGPLGTLKAYGGAMADSENQQIVFQGPVFVTLIMDGSTTANKEKKQ